MKCRCCNRPIYYDVDSAGKIGLNIVGYAVGYARIGRAEAKPELYGALDEKHPTDEFVFAQIKHDGAWNVESGGASRLLEELRKNTSLRVSLKRVPVQPGHDDLSSFTFLYLSGLDDFHWDAGALVRAQAFSGRGRDAAHQQWAGIADVRRGGAARVEEAAARREPGAAAAGTPGIQLASSNSPGRLTLRPPPRPGPA